MKRRNALQKIAIGTGTFFILPSALISCEKDPEPNGGGNNGGNDIEVNMDDAKYEGLKTAGGFVVVTASEIIVANVGDDAFVALSSVCTHQGCTVGFNSGDNTFPCPCHGSIYNSGGAVINGPAPTALKKYIVNRTGNILVIT